MKALIVQVNETSLLNTPLDLEEEGLRPDG